MYAVVKATICGEETKVSVFLGYYADFYLGEHQYKKGDKLRAKGKLTSISATDAHMKKHGAYYLMEKPQISE